MSTQTEVSLPSTRTRSTPNTDLLSRRGGVFWGAVLLLIGVLWFLDTAGVVHLGDKFGELIVPFLFILGGLYLLAYKVIRR